MELDFGTVKALSSPTRIQILSKVLEEESTPTSLSNSLGKSKSTVSSHLETLMDADLVEKDAEEGRRRVVYQPTQKAQHIVEGRERRVKFSITSSIVSGIVGLAFVGSQFTGSGTLGLGMRSVEAEMQSQPGVMAAEGMDTAVNGADAATQGGLFDPGTAVLIAGVGFLALSGVAFLYGITMRRLG